MSVDSILRAKARALIQGGRLPSRLPARRWGGPGLGIPCMVCGVPISDSEVGFEVEFTRFNGADASSQHFHVRCLTALEHELRECELAMRTASTPPQPQPQSATGAPKVVGPENGAVS